MTHTRRENLIDNWRWQMATFGGYVEIICFRSSCRRGRSSSFSPPGFVREDEKLVNTVPVVCFCRFWRNCLPSVQWYRIISPTITKESPVIICPEVNISSVHFWLADNFPPDNFHSVLIRLYVVTVGHIFCWTPQSALFFLKCIIMAIEQGAHSFLKVWSLLRWWGPSKPPKIAQNSLKIRQF